MHKWEGRVQTLRFVHSLGFRVRRSVVPVLSLAQISSTFFPLLLIVIVIII